MSTRIKIAGIAVAACAVVLPGVFLLLRTLPVQPSPAIQTAQSFVDCLRSDELKRAYQLTIQGGEVGGNLGEFQKVAHRQWPAAAHASIRFLEARPRQSYGNRLRRWLWGQATDPAEMWVEFSVDGVPFQVREARVGNGEWKVSYFQSHAG